MSRKFKINRDYHDLGYNIYKKETITLNPGVTVLVGCNGSGKTTLLDQLKRLLEKEELPVIMFNNLHDGGHNSISEAMFYGDIEFVASSIQSSEGENITLNMINFARKIGSFTRMNKNAPEIWILLDAVDSGLSVDNVIDIKEYLFKTIIDENSNSDVYIVISANEYELARDEQCFDVINGKYIKFNDYEEYRDFILMSRNKKDEIHKNE